jgi:murein L,D-transpeptidase YafK
VRRVLVATSCLAALAFLTIVAWDFLKLNRRAAAMAPAQERADTVLVEKAARKITLLRDGRPVRTYPMSLGGNPTGHKQREGDQRTPEGLYAIDFKNARSRFHLALRVSYPNARDREHAAQKGVPAGGDIMIHGLPNGLGWLGAIHRSRDWTDGCAAVTNQEIEEIWSLVDVGTRVEIRP